MQRLLNNSNLINWAIIAVVVAIVLVLLYPVAKNYICEDAPENFDSVVELPEGINPEEGSFEVAPEEAALATAHKIDVPVNANGPFVDSKTGALIDGPGFEKGEIDDVHQERSTGIPSNYYFLDDGAGGEMSIQHNLCSPSCCSEQWPTPHKQKYDPYVCQNKDKFIPSNIMCNNSFQNSGCLCLSKKQGQFLYNRGGNGREWF